MITLDMNGNPCPIPVIKAKKELEKHDADGVIVLVDNIVAVQNLQKMANGMGHEFSYKQQNESFQVTIRKQHIGTGTEGDGSKSAPAEMATKDHGSKTVPAGIAAEDRGAKTVPAGITNEDHSSKTAPAGITNEDHSSKTVPAGITNEDHSSKTVPVGITNEDHSSKTAPAGITAKDHGSNPTPIIVTTAESDNSEVVPDASMEEGVTVLITSNQMGRGSEELGKILIKGFLFSLTELPVTPKAVIFLNSGVKLAVNGSNTIPDLQILADKGTKIRACGTCLNYYSLTEQLAVGEITDMFDITEYLASAARLLTL